MIFVAMPLGTVVDDHGTLINGPEAADVLCTGDQAEAADWAQARALQTRTDYQVFRLVETLYYKGKR